MSNTHTHSICQVHNDDPGRGNNILQNQDENNRGGSWLQQLVMGAAEFLANSGTQEQEEEEIKDEDEDGNEQEEEEDEEEDEDGNEQEEEEVKDEDEDGNEQEEEEEEEVEDGNEQVEDANGGGGHWFKKLVKGAAGFLTGIDVNSKQKEKLEDGGAGKKSWLRRLASGAKGAFNAIRGTVDIFNQVMGVMSRHFTALGINRPEVSFSF
jgi:hypothetical protein